ncbi:hypothetical protein JCM16408A_32640 [Methylobacterium phyllosphaerae]
MEAAAAEAARVRAGRRQNQCTRRQQGRSEHCTLHHVISVEKMPSAAKNVRIGKTVQPRPAARSREIHARSPDASRSGRDTKIAAFQSETRADLASPSPTRRPRAAWNE